MASNRQNEPDRFITGSRSPFRTFLAWAGRLAIAPVAFLLAPAAAGHSQEAALPPPPSVSVPDLAPVPESPAPTTPIAPTPNPDAAPREMIFQAPATAQPTAERYMVYVNGNSPYLLEQVRAVEPQAFVQTYRGQEIVQAGVFSSQANAQQQIAALSTRGVTAEVATLSVAYPTNPPGNAQLPDPLTNHYAVVIPASPSEFSRLAGEITRLGVRSDAVQNRMGPIGPHLAIGPFNSYEEAASMSRFLRSNGGIDARVFYRR